MSFWLYVLPSAAGGLLVGILGTGSSLILLPSLVVIFELAFASNDVLRLAAGTTMATIAVGAIAGAIAQYRANRLDLELFRLTLLPYVLGGLSGPWISRLIPTKALGIYVATIIFTVGLRMLIVKAQFAKSERDVQTHRLEVSVVLFLVSLTSSIAGVASGIFAIPFLCRYSLPFRTVIGTSTASAAVYATFGTVGYVTAGWSAADLPDGHFGYVYLPAFAVMAITAAAATPLGVHVAGYIDERSLKRFFAVFLLVAALTILWTGHN